MNELLQALPQLHANWWQALLLLILIGLRPVWRAVAVILVSKMADREHASISIPLILGERRKPRKLLGERITED